MPRLDGGEEPAGACHCYISKNGEDLPAAEAAIARAARRREALLPELIMVGIALIGVGHVVFQVYFEAVPIESLSIGGRICQGS
jgi:hypothetical protein